MKLQGIERAAVQSAELDHQGKDPAAKDPDVNILIMKGPYCTPRNVLKNMTTKSRPKLEDIAEKMKSLADGGIGMFKNISQRERVYYKPLPKEENRQAICAVIGEEKWNEYVSNFSVLDTKYITLSQHNRLLDNSPFTLQEYATYGIHHRDTHSDM